MMTLKSQTAFSSEVAGESEESDSKRTAGRIPSSMIHREQVPVQIQR